MTTIVTAFFDINRSTNGDGRTIDMYLKWIKETLKLNCYIYIVTEPKFKNFFIENRYNNCCLKIIDFKESYYYKYYDRMKNILDNNEYKKKIASPNRIECKLPEYNIIQYSKFHYLEMAINQNPFNSKYFFWLDAGSSRFFYNMNASKQFPSNKLLLDEYNDKFIVQQRPDLLNYKIDNNIIWKADNLIYGGMFGGSINIIQKISKLVEKVFVEIMLNNNNINNEQIALSIAWKNNPELFKTFTDITHEICLLHLL